jgi:hypothetical protein
MEGEPIFVKLRILNGGNRPVAFLLDEDTLQSFRPSEYRVPVDPLESYPGGCRVRFFEGTEQLPGKPLYLTQTYERGIRLAPGEAHEVTPCLQRLARQLGPGKHELSYEMHMPYYYEDEEWISEENRMPFVDTKGKLVLTISPKDEKRLKEIYKDSGHEALCCMEDPLVVPYLLELFNKEFAPSNGFEGLARFPGDEKARQFMLERVSAGHEGTYTIEALDVLAKWKVELTPADVRRLLKSKDNNVWEATLRYIDKMRPKYNNLASNPD